MAENPKYPWTPWNVDYLKKQLQKDLRRVAQTIANHQYVANLLESRAAAKSEKPAAVQTQQAAERPGVAQ
jgi:sensor histidine kinase regulating citrate/malate metabolism